MIKRFIPGIANKTTPVKERRISATKHAIDPSLMSPLAVSVVDKLLDAGYQAYIVGGCIRDALLGREPKDFDVATSATPEQVKQIFRRSRIIGRRFRIVHVQERREIIEVTTFRGSHKNSKTSHATQNNQGVLLRDNVYGTLEEDALRRDFTCNSLYYDIDSHDIVDFMDGVKDLKKGVLRTIGDPAERFQEDPVRMMRALRFQAKLGLKPDPASSRQLTKKMPMIREVSAARMFDEVIKLLMHTQARSAFKLMCKTGLFQQLFPWSEKLLGTSGSNQANYQELLEVAMRNTEERLRNNKRVSPFYLYSTLLWPAVEREYKVQLENRIPPARAMAMAGSKIIDMQGSIVSIAKRFALPMRDTWHLQTQLSRRSGNGAQRLLDHPRFRAAYDFILMREEAGEDLEGLGKWWTEFQSAGEREKEKMVGALRGTKRQGSNSRGRRSGTRPAKAPSTD